MEVPEDSLGEPDVKIILLGDSAVGKSKLVERFMMNEYQPRQEVELDGENGKRTVKVGAYWHLDDGASVTKTVFDVTRKVTYQNLANWYKELREYCENIPCFLVANKIDVDMNVTSKKFKFAETHNLEFSFVSAADGTNVVKVFKEAVEAACKFKQDGGDFMSDVLDLLGEKSK
ncbi:P-loop containing nucleoside triphosphate hydrolase [Phytophthora cactorum]|nr:P-loop containing nucleoside triphosphate hydrolase [Phytophthora cactorum]